MSQPDAYDTVIALSRFLIRRQLRQRDYVGAVRSVVRHAKLQALTLYFRLLEVRR